MDGSHQPRRVTTSNTPRRFAAATVSFILAACGGGSGSAPAGEPFTLVSVQPENSQRDVQQSTPVVARFSAPIDTASFTPASFKLAEDGASEALPATLSFPLPDTAALAPDSPYRLLGTYVLTLADTLRDKAGRTLARQTSSFVTHDGFWEPAHRLLSDGHRAQQPALAIDGRGHALVGFTSRIGESDKPTARVVAYDSSRNSWGPIITIGNGQGEASGMKLAANASNAAVAVWTQLNSTGTRVGLFASEKPAAGAFGGSRSISAGDGLIVGPAEVAIDAAGNAVAVWPQDLNTIQASRFDAAAGRWSEPVALSAPGSRAAKPHVAMAASGDALVVWAQSAPNLVQSIRYRAVTKAWEEVRPVTRCVPLSSAPCAIQGGEVDDPRIAVAPNGDAVAVWSEKVPGGERTDVWSNVLAGSGWENPRKLTPTGGAATRPQVATDAGGNAYAVWQVASGAEGGKVAGGRIRAPALPTSSAVAVQELPMAAGADVAGLKLAVDPRGHLMAVWSQAGSGIWAARRVAGAGWAAPRPIGSEPGANADSPQVTIDSQGRAIAVFHLSAGGLDKLGANHFR